MATTITGTTIDVGPNKLVANSAGNVGINTASPTSPLHITGSGHTAVTITGGASSDAQIRFGDSANTTIGMINYDNAIDALKFVVNGSTAAIIDNGGRAIIGNGITLGNGTTYAAANTLSDYETGSWTPAFGRNGGTQPTPTYGEQVGSYTKVGDMVFLTGDMYISAISIPDNGNLVITGMPFTKGSGHNPTGSFTFDGFNFGRARSQLVHLDGTKLGFLGQAASTGAGSWGWEELSGLGGGESLRFAITYQV